MGNQRQTLNLRGNLLPHFREYRSVLSIGFSETMLIATEPLVVTRLRIDQRIEAINYLSLLYYDNAHTANTAAALVGGLKVDGRKVHIFFIHWSDLLDLNSIWSCCKP